MCAVYDFVGQFGAISTMYFILHGYVAEPPLDKQLTCDLIRWAHWTGFVINA